MKSPTIELKDVSKKFVIPHEKVSTLKATVLSLWKRRDYESFYALKDISFSVREGEFLGVVGGNGSGKSTLLKVIAGIYVPDSGDVSVKAGISPFLELGVGFNGELTGRENVYLYGAVLGLARKQIESRFDEIVSFAGVKNFIDLKMKNYSSGMFSRLAFSVAIQAHAPILLMDEVLAVGDADFQKKCFAVFDGFKRDGKTVVLVSHDTKAICSYCDRAILMEGGRIRECGDPGDVVKAYSGGISIDKTRGKAPVELARPVSNKKLEIVGFEVLNSKGNSQSVFKSSEEILVRVMYKMNIRVEKPVLGILLSMGDGREIFGTNTKIKGLSSDSIPISGSAIIRIKKPPILKGKLFCTIAFTSHDDHESYDWLDKCFSIDIANDSDDAGYIPCDVEFEFG
jgi:lipopolysaccharide transport system ATP-binding protein